MFKFLRKYSKWILAIGGTLLMITFLIPQAIQTLSQRAAITGATWAVVGEDEEAVTSEDLQRVQAELRLFTNTGSVVPIGIELDDNEPGHWYLLEREAEFAGLTGGRASDAIPAEQMQAIFSMFGQDPFVDEALGRVESVRRMLSLYAGAGKLSDNRLRAFARREFHGVEARFVAIEARAGDDAPMPGEAEILAQFEAYRDVEPGAGAHGFGYRLPDRFQVEWITIAESGIRAMIENTGELTYVALARHWQRATDRGFPVAEPGAEIPDVVRNDLLRELVDAKRDLIEKFTKTVLLETWRRLKATNGYRELPEDWNEQRLPFAELAERIQKEFPGLPLPVYESVGDRWLSVGDLIEFPDLQSASTQRFGGIVRAADLISGALEFGGHDTIRFQQGIASDPLRTADGGVVILRLHATDPARPPRDPAEVRDRIVRDLRRKAAYDDLLARRSGIEAIAQSRGLLAVAIDHDTEVLRPAQVTLYTPGILDIQLQRNLPLLAQPSLLPVIDDHRPTIERIIDAALALPMDASFPDLPLAERTLVVPVDDAMMLFAVELLRQVPLDRERYDRLAARGLYGLVLRAELNDLGEAAVPVTEAYGYDALADRHEFKVQGVEAETEGDAPADADAPPARAGQ